MKKYPFRCPQCLNVIVKSKTEIKALNRHDRDGDYYSFHCPTCNHLFSGYEFGNFLRKYNPGQIDNKRMVIYKVGL